MHFVLRQEQATEYATIHDLIRVAFETAQVRDGNEQNFADHLRTSTNYIPELALVAQNKKQLIGHIMLTKTEVRQDNNAVYQQGLLLAPLSVVQEYRNQGIGSALMHEGLKRAKALGYSAVFLCGNPAYYTRFGFLPLQDFAIRSSQNIPHPYGMACELRSGALQKVQGILKCF